ncbi:MAG: VCBS repeat-containing protein, partial [Prevotellaceae bacterium]|nr:VCBS repeat-containing protein [Prevotellaceae bacterium]
PDVTSNARKGILESDFLLLDRIDVLYDNIDTLRQYYFGYKKGAFGKTLLKNVLDVDSLFRTGLDYNEYINKDVFNRNKVSTNGMESDQADEYYSIKYSFDYFEEETLEYASSAIINAGNDNYMDFESSPSSGITNPRGALGGSSSKPWNTGAAFCAGFGYDGWWKLITAGGNYTYNSDKNKSYLTMADLNGDGYPDKLFKDNYGNIQYRLQQIDDNGNSSFETEAHTITNISDFNLSKSHSNNFGFEVQFGVTAGFDWSTSHSNTYLFLSDADGDGLVDIIDGETNKVFYNRLDAFGKPTFTDYSKEDTIWINTASCDSSFILNDGEVDEEIFRYSFIDSIVSDSCQKYFVTEIIPIEECELCQNVFDTVWVRYDGKNGFITIIKTGEEYYYDEKEGCYISKKDPKNKICVLYETPNGYYTLVEIPIDERYHNQHHTRLVEKEDCIHNVTYFERSDVPFYAPDIQAVRAWIAPYSGQINISGTAQLTQNLHQYRYKYRIFDGVRLSIQKRNDISNVFKKELHLTKADSINNPTVLMDTVINVNAGDIIYFWVESKSKHDLDVVEWNPIIEYSNSQLIETQTSENISNIYNSEHNNFVFNAKNDFMLNTPSQKFGIPLDGDIIIKPIITSNSEIIKEPLKFRIYLSDMLAIDEWIDNESPINYTDNIEYLGALRGDSLEFTLECAGQVDWSKIDASIQLYYTQAFDNIPDENNMLTYTSLPVLDTYTVPNETIYSISYNPYIHKVACHYAKLPSQKVSVLINAAGKKYFEPSNISVSGFANDIIRLTVKEENGNLLASGQYRKNAGSTLDVIDSCIIDTSSLVGNIYIDYYIENPYLGQAINSISTKVKNNNIYHSTISTSGFYTNYADSIYSRFGNIYRGWTQFGYKPSNPTKLHIDESLLNLDYLKINANDTAALTNSLPTDTADTNNLSRFENMHPENSVAGGMNPLSGNFFIMTPDYKKKRYIAYTEIASIAKDTMWNDVIFDDFERTITRIEASNFPIPFVPANEKAKVISKMTRTKPFGVRLGAFGLGVSCSKSKTTVESDYMDLNGDRYPDIVAAKKIQYSKPQGGLSSKKAAYDVSAGIDQTVNTAFGASASLGVLYMDRELSSNVKKGKAVGKSKSSPSFGITGTGGSDDAKFTWQDMNGDGLPDKVDVENRKIYYNLGYSLSEPQTISESVLRQSESKSFSASVGAGVGNMSNFFDVISTEFEVAYSISGGVGMSYSDNFSKFVFQDVNADGLPDKVKYEGNKIFVSYSNGLNYSYWQEITNNGSVNFGRSYNFSVNAAGTVGFSLGCIPLKLTFTISGGASWSISADEERFMDFNNDGYPDIVKIDENNRSNIVVYYAKPMKSNILKTIETPTNIIIALDYELTRKSTKESPNRNWEMSSCYLSEFGKYNSRPPMKNIFEYETRQYDRFEREDYGYKTVRTFNMSSDTIHNHVYHFIGNYIIATSDISHLKPYIITENWYKNENWFYKGILDSTIVKDTANHIFTKTEKIANAADIATGVVPEKENAHCYGGVYPVIIEEKNYFYENAATPQITTRKNYSYGSFGNRTGYSNLGDVADNSDNISGTLHYYTDENRYIVGMVDTIIYSAANSPHTYKKTAVINAATGNIKTIKTHGSHISQVDYKYDSYGNITKAVLPQNSNGRPTISIVYDNILHCLPTQIVDTLGYSSSKTYDFRYQVPLTETDKGGSTMKYTYDTKGRLKTIQTPKDTGITIKYEYWDSQKMYQRRLIMYRPSIDIYHNYRKWVLTQHFNVNNIGDTLNVIA